MELLTSQYRDPEQLIRQVSRRVPLEAGAAYLVLVDRPSTAQRIRHLERFDAPAELTDHEAASAEIRDRMERLPVVDGDTYTHSVMTVVVRPGRCVIGPAEKQWFLAWRYANHFRRVFSGDILVVTEHGWFDLDTEWGGHTPRMRAAS